MFPKNQSDVEYPDVAKHGGTRKDGRNLVAEWVERMKHKVSCAPGFVSLLLWPFPAFLGVFRQHARSPARPVFAPVQKGHYVWNKQQLASLNPNQVDYLLGTCRPPRQRHPSMVIPLLQQLLRSQVFLNPGT